MVYYEHPTILVHLCCLIPCFLLRLADLMEEHQEELATLESLDSGAVYTLALKTHIGFSINTFRYFAGWCDKIQVCVVLYMYNTVTLMLWNYHRILNTSACAWIPTGRKRVLVKWRRAYTRGQQSRAQIFNKSLCQRNCNVTRHALSAENTANSPTCAVVSSDPTRAP